MKIHFISDIFYTFMNLHRFLVNSKKYPTA